MSKYTDAIRELAKRKALDANNAETLLNAHVREQDGGPGSGNFSHKGRPGKRGGSAPREGGGNYGHAGRPCATGGPSIAPTKKMKVGHGAAWGSSKTNKGEKNGGSTATLEYKEKHPEVSGRVGTMRIVHNPTSGLQFVGKTEVGQPIYRDPKTGKEYVNGREYEPYLPPNLRIGKEEPKKFTLTPEGARMIKGEVGRGSAAGRALRQNKLAAAGVRKYGDYWIAKDPETLKDPHIQAMIKAQNGGKMPNVGQIYYSNGMPEDLDNGFKVGGPSPSAFKLDKKAKEAVQTFMNNGGLEKLGRRVDNKVKEFEKGGGLTGLAKKADKKINSFLKQGGTSKYGERADKAIQTFLQNGGMMNVKEPSETETSELSPEAAKSRKAIQDQFKAARAFLRKEMQNFHRGSEDMKHFHDALEDMKKPLGTRPSPEESEAYSKKFASNISSKMDDYTKKKYLKAIEDEPKITKDMCDIAESMGYGFFGLNYRLKSGGDNDEGVCRLMQKRQEYLDEALAKKKPITPEQATDKLKDMVRYTLCVSQDTMGDDADKVLGELEKRNYKIIKIGNTWTEQKGDNPYRGLNCAVVSPDGTTFELQFHSPESYATKNALHGRYEIARGEKSTKKKKKEANGVMRHYYNALRTPKGLEKLQPRIDRLG